MNMNQNPVHFGPVWGRPPSQSMALCMDGKDPGKEFRTMTRTATITCETCLKLLATLPPADTATQVKEDVA